ncbi:hypothetical protein Nepgr_012391 [Nepenthes gracilis]|uniref:Uncharacterized protein n=1 Tax=Nepenthes gracilis TaxID=150966 RepID=A0AAD3SFQ4_NEPGR|nr:hypothetical protein Nepgr_012391 [Nepenthes gracilis]
MRARRPTSRVLGTCTPRREGQLNPQRTTRSRETRNRGESNTRHGSHATNATPSPSREWPPLPCMRSYMTMALKRADHKNRANGQL